MEIKEVQSVKQEGLFAKVAELGHEQVVHCYDEATGLKALIAIHNTALGPSLGGTRMWNENRSVPEKIRKVYSKPQRKVHYCRGCKYEYG